PCQPIPNPVAQARRLLDGAHCRPMSHSTPQVNPRISSAGSAAGVVARFLKARGVDRIFALCGGHIMPLWMRADAEGIRIVDVRDERAAVHMAQAHAELTGGLGVALVTAGPGVTNAMTGIANAHVSRAPVLVLSGSRAVAAAVELLWSARRPLVISGRGARGAGPELRRLLDKLGAVYLDTGESRGLVPDEHPSVVAAMRGSVMGEADLVVT